jgi:hypothetical protein
MTGAATAKHSVADASHSTVVEVALRVIGASLHIVATLAVVRALSPNDAGIYFRGFVVALGFAAVLRAKYELFIAHHIIGRCAGITEVSNGVLLLQLGWRVLLRSALVCAALLVVTADIDIQAPRFEPALETYLPFVLAIPCVSLSTFIGEALRAANRTLFGTIIAAYAINLSILLAVAIAPAGSSPFLYAWAFFGGSLISAVLAVILGRLAFPADWTEGKRPICREALTEADERELIGLGRAALLWGPLCLLAVSASAIEMAQFAIAYRTAMVVDFFVPALNLSGRSDLLRITSPIQVSRALLLSKLGRALFYSSLFVGVLLAASPFALRIYGSPYSTQLPAYALLLVMQWANGVGRPAIRYTVFNWDSRRIRAAVSGGAFSVLLVCVSTIGSFGAVAAAAATLAGALVFNCWSMVDALRRSHEAETFAAL